MTKIGIIFKAMIATLIFFPTRDYTALPEHYGLKSEEVRVTTEDGVKLIGWFLPAEPVSAGVVYLLHGNAGNISDRLFKAAEWVRRGFSVFLLDYRSYGKSEGKITSERDLVLDAEAGIRWLREVKKVENAKLILYGESIGCAPVIELARKTPFRALILEAPFTSLPEVCKVHYPFIPTAILGAFQLRNLDKISEIKSPVFVIHGEDDEICPFSMGEMIFEKAPEPKEFFRIPHGHHNDLPDAGGPSFYDKPVQFISKLTSREANPS